MFALKLPNMPLVGCWLAEDYQEQGMSPVVVARRNPEDNRLAVAVFLCDLLCLGVKDAFFEPCLNDDQLDTILDQQSQEMQKITYDKAREIILGAVKYADDLGIQPHPDYAEAKATIEPDKPFQYKKTRYGKNGKPFYYAGPYDNLYTILEKLEETVGPNNFTYVIDESLL